MAKTKYIYHDDLKKYSKFYVPISKFSLPFLQLVMKSLYAFEKSNKKFTVKKEKIKSFDNKNIKVLVYTPKDIQLNDSCLYYIHGGGYVFNSAPHHFKLAKQMALKLKCKLVFVDYRLAPKYKFPTALKDCYEVYKWIINNKELNINPSKIIIAGDSAGGNLSLTTTFMAHDNNLVLPKCLVLLYPVTTHGYKTESYLKYNDTPMCNSKDGEKYDKLYYPRPLEELKEYANLVDLEIFDDFPPTYIEVAQYDCLHDDGVLFYNKLVNKNMICKFYEVKDAMHGYDIAIGSKLIDELIEKRIEFINKYIDII